MEIMNVNIFMQRIESQHKAVFPNSWIRTEYRKDISDCVSIVFGVQSPDKFKNKIQQNDPGWQALYLFDGVKSKEMLPKIKLEGGHGRHSLLVKPKPNSNNVYSSIRFGFRGRTDTPEKILEHIGKYFKKMKKVIDDNRDKLLHDLT